MSCPEWRLRLVGNNATNLEARRSQPEQQTDDRKMPRHSVQGPAAHPAKRWALTHVFRFCTALMTLAAFALGFLYKPEWLTWWFRTTMAGIETASGALPYPWGDRFEVAMRGIGGSFWIQITLAILIVRVAASLLAWMWRRARR
jgi:hypothetical protein